MCSYGEAEAASSSFLERLLRYTSKQDYFYEWSNDLRRVRGSDDRQRRVRLPEGTVPDVSRTMWAGDWIAQRHVHPFTEGFIEREQRIGRSSGHGSTSA